MAKRTGSADLPLHGGRVPAWLGRRMSLLGSVICQAIVHHYGRDEFLRRLSHPFWFQSFGAVRGMDWHSSGITTSVIGALKRGLGPLQGELGIHVCGGRGSWRTPDELAVLGDRLGLDAPALTRASRLVAKVGVGGGLYASHGDDAGTAALRHLFIHSGVGARPATAVKGWSRRLAATQPGVMLHSVASSWEPGCKIKVRSPWTARANSLSWTLVREALGFCCRQLDPHDVIHHGALAAVDTDEFRAKPELLFRADLGRLWTFRAERWQPRRCFDRRSILRAYRAKGCAP